MEERGRQRRGEAAVENRAEASVRAHESCPGRVVFTLEGNTDAWIASDLTVEPEQ